MLERDEGLALELEPTEEGSLALELIDEDDGLALEVAEEDSDALETADDDALTLKLTDAEVELADELAETVLLEDGKTVVEDAMVLEIVEDVPNSELLGVGVAEPDENDTLELELRLAVEEFADSVLLKDELLAVMNAELLSLELEDEETGLVLLGEGVTMLEGDDALELEGGVADSVLLDDGIVALSVEDEVALTDDVGKSVLLEDTGVDDSELDDAGIVGTSDEEAVSEVLLAELLREGVAELDTMLPEDDAELLETTDVELEVGSNEADRVLSICLISTQ